MVVAAKNNCMPILSFFCCPKITVPHTKVVTMKKKANIFQKAGSSSSPWPIYDNMSGGTAIIAEKIRKEILMRINLVY